MTQSFLRHDRRGRVSHIPDFGLTVCVRLAKTSGFERSPRRLLYGHFPHGDGYKHDRLNVLLARHVETSVVHRECRKL